MKAVLSARHVAALDAREKTYFVWDEGQPGFGLKVTPAGAKSFVVKYRLERGRGGQTRRVTLGRYPTLHPNEARRLAQGYLGQAAFGVDLKAKQDEDRVSSRTVAQAIEAWADGPAKRHRRTGEMRKPENVKDDVDRLTLHVTPLIGRKRIQSLTRADLERLRDDITNGATAGAAARRGMGGQRAKGGPYVATRVLQTLNSVLCHELDHERLAKNPMQGIRMPPSRKNERFLTPTELRELSDVLARWEDQQPTAVAILRLLVLTGARRGEIAALKWSEVDAERGLLRLGDTKTGKSIRPISDAAIDLIRAQPRRTGSPWVFPASRGDHHFQGTPRIWERIREEAGLEDVRIHDLRHTYASVAVDQGYSPQEIGRFLGHKSPTATARYSHLRNDPLRQKANLMGDYLASLTNSGQSAT